MSKIKLLSVFLFLSWFSSAQEPFSTYRSSFIDFDYDIMISQRNNGVFSLWISAVSLDNPATAGGFVVREKDYPNFIDALDLAKVHYEDLVEAAKKKDISEQYKSLRVFAKTDAFFYKEQWNYQYDLALNFEFFADTVGHANRYMLVLNTRPFTSNVSKAFRTKGFSLVFCSVAEIDDFRDKISYAKVNAHVLKADTVGLFSTKRRAERLDKLDNRTGFFANTRFGIKVGSANSFDTNNRGASNNDGLQVMKENMSMSNCIDVGLTGRYKFDKFFVETGVSYTFGSVFYNFAYRGENSQSVEYKRDLKLKTLDFPLYLAWSFYEKKHSGLSILAGPKLRVNVGSEPRNTYFSTLGNSKVTDLSHDISPAILGFDTGIQYNLYRLKFGLTLSVMKDISQTYVQGKALSSLQANAVNFNLSWEL